MKKTPLITAILALGLAAVQAHAAIITWFGRGDVTDVTDVANTGTFIAAESGYFTTVTVNGVAFAPQDTNNGIDFGASTPAGTPGYGTASPTADADFNAMLRAGYFSPGNGSPDTITLSGLTVGLEYRVQVFVGSWNATYPTTFLDPGSNSIDLLNDTDLPTFAFGTFTADATTQSLFYKGTDASHGLVSAVALYAIPEPSTYAALAGLAALGCAFRRRRARA